MKFLDRIGLAKSIEIPVSCNQKTLEEQLLNFKNSKKDNLGFLYSSSFIPSELTIKNGHFVIEKNPRLFQPLAAIGEIKGKMIPNEKKLIEVRVFSLYPFLVLMFFMTTVMGMMVFYILDTSSVLFASIWFIGIQLFNVPIYFLLRYHVQRLEHEFLIFINEQILKKAP